MRDGRDDRDDRERESSCENYADPKGNVHFRKIPDNWYYIPSVRGECGEHESEV